MKTKLTLYLLAPILLIGSIEISKAQTAPIGGGFTQPQQALQLAYDDTGNRYLRHIITIGQAPPPPDYKTDSTAIGNALFEASLKVFPNPVVADLNITSSVEIENATLFLYNTTGQLVYQQTYNGFAEQIQMSGLPAGNYILHLRNEEEDYTWQIIKQ